VLKSVGTKKNLDFKLGLELYQQHWHPFSNDEKEKTNFLFNKFMVQKKKKNMETKWKGEKWTEVVEITL
jgi:hypothetical protein